MSTSLNASSLRQAFFSASIACSTIHFIANCRQNFVTDHSSTILWISIRIFSLTNSKFTSRERRQLSLYQCLNMSGLDHECS